MSGRPFLSGRIPQDLHERIEEYCKEEYVSKTEVMIEALRKYLNCPSPIGENEAALESKIKELEERLKQVEVTVEIQLENVRKIGKHVTVATIGSTQSPQSDGEVVATTQKALPFEVESEVVTIATSGEVFLKATENQMGQASGVNRSKLKRHREKIQEGRFSKNKAVDGGVINGRACKLYLKEKEGRSWMWEARSI